MMKIAIGSKSEQKNKYLVEVLADLEIKDYEIIAFSADSKVTNQPLSSEETKKGSVNRAEQAYNGVSGSDFSVGIEVGFLIQGGVYKIHAWATVFDGVNRYSSKSHDLLLPKFHQDKIKSGLYLGDYVREFYMNNKNCAKRILANNIINRDIIIKNAAYHALLYYFNGAEY